MTTIKRISLGIAALLISLGYCFVSAAFADPLKSTHYQFQETALGGLGVTQTSSAHYQAASAGGLLGLGTSASATMQVQAGHETTNDPALSFAINNGSVSFGSFSPSTAATASTTFQVLDYTSFGYIVQMLGTAPTKGTHTISAMASTATSAPGTEQFGLNLVANTSPVSFGANPDHGQFGFGSATSNYATANNYRFVPGETIASAPRSSGLTTYTISYIVNVDSFTPGGSYSGSQTILCTGTY